MANQQLIDYVKGQMVAGVSELDIRKILKDAGWPDADIEEGINGAKPASAGAPVSTTTPVIGSSTGQAAKPAEPAKTELKTESKKEAMSFDFMSNPAGMSMMGSVASGAKDAGKPAAAAMSADGAVKSSGGRLPWIIAGVAILALVGSGVYFFNKVGALSDLSDQLTAANASLTTQLTGLNTSGATSASELAAVQAGAKEVKDELALFVIPQNTTGTLAATPFSLKGLVGQTKGIYTLTTVNGIMLSVKNSKDAKLDSSMKPLVGATAELSGTHIPGTYEITVQLVNGSELQAAATSTPSQATSTPSAP